MRENEVYFKTKERASVGANNILCFSVRTGKRHWVCPEAVVRKVRSITVEYEE